MCLCGGALGGQEGPTPEAEGEDMQEDPGRSWLKEAGPGAAGSGPKGQRHSLRTTGGPGRAGVSQSAPAGVDPS